MIRKFKAYNPFIKRVEGQEDLGETGLGTPAGMHWMDIPKDLENTSRKFPLNKKYPLMPKSMKVVTKRFPISQIPQAKMIVHQTIPEGIVMFSDKKKELREELAALEHEQWIEWSKNIVKTEDITEERKKRWEKLWVPYEKLSEEDKDDKDREWADRVLDIIRKYNGGKND